MIKIGGFFNGLEILTLVYDDKKKGKLLAIEKLPATNPTEISTSLSTYVKERKLTHSSITLSMPSHNFWTDVLPINPATVEAGGIERAVYQHIDEQISQKGRESLTIQYSRFHTEKETRYIIEGINKNLLSVLQSGFNDVSTLHKFKVESSFSSLSRLWQVDKPSLIVHVERSELLICVYDPLPNTVYSQIFPYVAGQQIVSVGIKSLIGSVRRAVVYGRGLKKPIHVQQILVSGFLSDQLAEHLKAVGLPVAKVATEQYTELGISEDAMIPAGALMAPESEEVFLKMQPASQRTKHEDNNKNRIYTALALILFITSLALVVVFFVF